MAPRDFRQMCIRRSLVTDDRVLGRIADQVDTQNVPPHARHGTFWPDDRLTVCSEGPICLPNDHLAGI